MLGRLQEFDPQVEKLLLTLSDSSFILMKPSGGGKESCIVAQCDRSKNSRHPLEPTCPHAALWQNFRSIVASLEGHFDLKLLIIGERFHFCNLFQKANESIAEFVAYLRFLSIRWEFVDFLDQALREHFVFGARQSRRNSW